MSKNGAGDREELKRIGERVEIGNEFALVFVQKVMTRNGARLEIVSPKLSYRILLDPVQLESLTWQDAELFSELLQTPFGPEAPPPN